MIRDTFFKVGGRPVSVRIIDKGDHYRLSFPYVPAMVDETKATFNTVAPHWDKPNKQWCIEKSEHTDFRIKYMEHGAGIAYARWDQPLVDYVPRPKVYRDFMGQSISVMPYNHQQIMVRRGLTSHYCVWGAEMGTGKSLAAILLMEENDRRTKKVNEYWWIGPKNALESAKLECDHWQCMSNVTFMTYEGLIKTLADWPAGKLPPIGVFFDEASRLKNPITKRSQAARYLARNIRSVHGDLGFVICMSGSPAPKSPVDWYNICETVWPGFLREGNQYKFLERLAITQREENGVTGGTYVKKVRWRDEAGICHECGQTADHVNHVKEDGPQTAEEAFSSLTVARTSIYHEYQEGKNEVAHLYTRMKGLVEVFFKKDCLDLPEKIYKIINVTPSKDTLRAMKLIKNSGKGAAQILGYLRELSDGFQYKETVVGTQDCVMCGGKRLVDDNPCPGCHGMGIIQNLERTTLEVDCPKDDALLEIMEDQEDLGRLIVFGGFTATLDRIQKLITKKAETWSIIRVDGKGWWHNLKSETEDIGNDPKTLLTVFQERQKEFPGIVFLGHPAAAGMGLTLTAADTIVYYSNTFAAEDRIQSEDRIHRPGSRGANIIDLVHLPSDLVVLENLRKKRELQGLTMGELEAALVAANYFEG